MPHSLALPVLTAVAIVGATAAGVGLGHSAIAEINPAHFQESTESQFYGDLAPNHRADWGAVSAAEYQQQAAAPPPATAAVAATWPVAAPPARDPKIDRVLNQAWREASAPKPDVRYVERVVYVEPRPDPVPERVHRYASYPVSRDEVPPPPPPPEDDGPDGGDAATQ